jgi:large conductance mechanosensitive channel
MGFLSEFKEFAVRGNVVDLAVAVVIGGAFGKIVTSLVNDIIMPVIGKLAGGVNFNDLAVVLTPAQLNADGSEAAAAVLLRYGAFLQSILDFVLVAFAIFLAVKAINRLRRAPEPVAAEPAPPAEEVLLLREIRDSLRPR